MRSVVERETLERAAEVADSFADMNAGSRQPSIQVACTTKTDISTAIRNLQVQQGARISQADMERAAKAVAKSGLACARIIVHLRQWQIEIIIGESDAPAAVDDEGFEDEDV